MIFNEHSNLRGYHAPFSPSQYGWLRYDDDKAIDVYNNKKAAERGTRLHAWAKETIDLGIKQQKTKKTLCAYVNDAIGYKMDTEVVLFYSKNFFGTADAICFRNGILRIHDYKSGVTPAKMEQLEIYAALFCLEYKLKPSEIEIELRLYQSDEISCFNPLPEEISSVMEQIVHLDKLITKIEQKEG